MLNKTFEMFDKTLKMFDKEMKDLFGYVQRNKKSGTRVKIKAGSKVLINGASVELLNDVVVLTTDPDKLMQSK